MKTLLVVGVALVVLGAAVLGFEHYSYTTRESVLQIGPIRATAEQTHTVALPAILGWLLIAGGVCALVFAAAKKS